MGIPLLWDLGCNLLLSRAFGGNPFTLRFRLQLLVVSCLWWESLYSGIFVLWDFWLSRSLLLIRIHVTIPLFRTIEFSLSRSLSRIFSHDGNEAIMEPFHGIEAITEPFHDFSYDGIEAITKPFHNFFFTM
jgi:hypothetical protein